MNLKGLSKEIIDQLFFCEKGEELFEIFSNKICEKNKDILIMALLELHHYIPLSKLHYYIESSSIGIRKFMEKYVKYT
jgi:hypothetical protein